MKHIFKWIIDKDYRTMCRIRKLRKRGFSDFKIAHTMRVVYNTELDPVKHWEHWEIWK